MLAVGNTLLIPTPPNNKEHLFIIIAIEKSSNSALLVNITSPRIGRDNTCCINIGDHPFVTHISVINYLDSRITPIANLEYCLDNSIFKKHSPVTPQVLKRIQDSALKSPDIKKAHFNFLISNIKTPN
jgi:hypothetical protein